MKKSRIPYAVEMMAVALGLTPATPAISEQSAAPEPTPAVRQIRVDIDFARIIRLPEGARTLVLGNPLIADATLLRSDGLVVVTGKSFGSTNLLMLDADGARVAEAILTVAPTNSWVVVFRGPGRRESLACDPECVRSVTLADDPEDFEKAVKSAESFRSAGGGAGAPKLPGQ